jgi:O-antigen polymerase
MSTFLSRPLPGITFFILSLILVLSPSIDFLPFFNPTVSGKFFIFSFLMETACLLFLLDGIFYFVKIKITQVDLLFAALLAYVTLNRYVFQTSVGFSIRYYELIGLSALYLMLRSTIREKNYYYFFFAAIIGANIQIVTGYLQLYNFIASNSSFFKATGGFFNSGPFAGFLASVFIIALYFLKNGSYNVFGDRFKVMVKALLVFNILGTISLIPVLMSRASYIAILMGCIFIYIDEIASFFKKITSTRLNRILLYVFTVIIIIAVGVSLILLKKESAKGRLLILKASVTMASDNLVFGVGLDRFKSQYMDYQAEYLRNHPNPTEAIYADNTVYALNEGLQFVIEQGVVGLVLLAMFLYFLLRNARKDNDLVQLSIIGLAVIFAFSVFSYSSEILPIKIVAFLFISVIASLHLANPTTIDLSLNALRANPMNKYRLILPLLLLAALLFISSFTQSLQTAKGYFEWREANLKTDIPDLIASKKHFEKAYSVLKDNGEFLADYGRCLYYVTDYTKGIEVLKKAAMLSSNTVVQTTLGDCQRSLYDLEGAERSYKTAIDMKPSSFHSRFLLFKLYEESSQVSKAIDNAKELLKLKVKIPSEEVDGIKNEARFFLSERSLQIN